MIKRLLSLALALTASVTVLTAQTSNNKKESLIFCDEGGWQQNTGQLSLYNINLICNTFSTALFYIIPCLLQSVLDRF